MAVRRCSRPEGILHEDRKLKEAWSYLVEMHARERDPSAFIHLLSGFLSAARSVAQYAHKEATGKAGGAD